MRFLFKDLHGLRLCGLAHAQPVTRYGPAVQRLVAACEAIDPAERPTLDHIHAELEQLRWALKLIPPQFRYPPWV